ncbi:F0F1 ATP synthase subunit B [Levilactobacillus humaensis]|uniref:F0F1 ATP synthase subunit B n=1 Tax=Levilactobacillus humaensis TaxID=2950375 RepID=UPI0021C39CA0|nr:F0F1 ATP synthase subunit B [Levilactobacillus humaensis]
MLSHLVIDATLYNGDSIFYVVTFLLLMWLVKIFAWGPITKMMQQRSDKISDDIDHAEKSRAEAADLADQRQEALQGSRVEAQQIVSTAKSDGQEQRGQIINKAEADAQALKAKAQDDIAQEREAALVGARNDVADLSIEIASKLIQRELNASDQKELIDSYIEGLGKPHES